MSIVIGNHEVKVETGELIFIIQKAKPLKTGWYRKVKIYDTEGLKNIYVFEKSLHPKYDMEDISLEHSRQINGEFVLQECTILSDKYKDNYYVCAYVTGINSVKLINNNYIPSLDYVTSYNSDYYELCGKYYVRNCSPKSLMDEVYNYLGV